MHVNKCVNKKDCAVSVEIAYLGDVMKDTGGD